MEVRISAFCTHSHWATRGNYTDFALARQGFSQNFFKSFLKRSTFNGLKREFVAVTRRSTKRGYGGGDSRKNFGETSFGQSLETTATFDWFRHFQIWVQGACLSSKAKTSQLNGWRERIIVGWAVRVKRF